MNRISLPANICKRKFLEKSLYSFYIGKDKVVIFSLIDCLTYIRSNLYYKMNKDVSFNIDTYIKWVNCFYNIQKSNESSYANRFLSKELLFRHILLEKFYSKKLISNVDEILRNNIQDKNIINNIKKGLSELKVQNIFFNSKFFNKYPEETENISSMNFYISMVLGMPFNENFYKIWVDQFEIYHLGEKNE